MALLDLKTDLKSLKYGNATSKGESPSQPYITVDIDTRKTGIKLVDNLFGTDVKGDDGFVRGGTVNAAKFSLIDTIRIGKFFTDAPKGPLFIAKQVGLQLSNPRISSKYYSKPWEGLLQSTRIYNLGVNTLAEIPVNAFGTHFNRHGLLPVQNEDTKYENVVRTSNENNQNRLVLLKDKLFNNFYTDIDNYVGGPGSVYGVGLTTIRKYGTNTLKNDLDNTILELGNTKAGKGLFSLSSTVYTPISKNENDSSILFKALGKGNNAISQYPDINTDVSVLGQVEVSSSFTIDYGARSKSYKTLEQTINSSLSNNPLFNIYNLASVDRKKAADKSLSISSETRNITYIGTRGVLSLPFSNWNQASRENRVGSGITDSINLTPLFYSTKGSAADRVLVDGDTRNINDLVKFRIQALDTDNLDNAVWMIFRAYLTQFSDSVDATWNDIQYIGRGDKFYIYSGFTRRIQIGFKIAALSAVEMKPMYQKLNYLMSNLMPDYGGEENITMRGPLVKMTVGNWIDGQDGIINSLNYTVPNDSPWEISLGDQQLILPHVVEVSMTFIPIGSQTRNSNFVPQKSDRVSNIAQNYNGANERAVEYVSPVSSSIAIAKV